MVFLNLSSVVLALCTKFIFCNASPVPGFANTDDNTSSQISLGELCLTEGCVKSAAEGLDNMDASENPCDNFYKFACGKFIKNAIIPHDKTEINTFTVITDKIQIQLRTILEEPVRDDELGVFKKVKLFYKSCMDTNKLEILGLGVVKDKLREWPILAEQNWEENNFSWPELIYEINKHGFGASPLFSVGVGTDLKNSTKRIIYVGLGDFGISGEYLKKGKDDKIIRAYYNYMVEIAIAFGANGKRAKQEMEDVLDLEILLANHTLPKEQIRNVSIIYNTLTITKLQSMYPSIPWLKYINNIMPNETQVDSEEIVLLTEPKYLKHLVITLKHISKRTLYNYIIWKFISLVTDYLTKEIQNIEFKYRQVVYGIKEMPARWKTCVNFIKHSLENLVSALYIRKYFNHESKAEILDIVKYIRKAFKQIIEENDWMDKETKRRALIKSEAMTEYIAYPDELLDDKLLTETYGKMDVLPDEFLHSALKINRFSTDFKNKRLRKPINKSEWLSHASTATVNAYFNQIENSIRFPAGVLQGHIFNSERPKYMNFGTLGSIVGHEITHGFDDVGRQFDCNGNLNEWWRKDTKKAFLEKVTCFIEQYSRYRVPGVNMTLNGNKTQGENIADNGGVKEAYLAYQSWRKENRPEPILPGLNYTANQMFWLSMAQNWCHKSTLENLLLQIISDNHVPAEYRVLVPLSNLKEFSVDFNCPLGSTMNPVRKCKVW